MLNATDKQSFGLNGCAVVAASGTSALDEYCAIQFITAGSLTSLTTNSITGATGVTFPAGFVLYGPFTQLTTAAGCSVVVYKASA